jgi:hypothetical protein
MMQPFSSIDAEVSQTGQQETVTLRRSEVCHSRARGNPVKHASRRDSRLRGDDENPTVYAAHFRRLKCYKKCNPDTGWEFLSDPGGAVFAPVRKRGLWLSPLARTVRWPIGTRSVSADRRTSYLHASWFASVGTARIRTGSQPGGSRVRGVALWRDAPNNCRAPENDESRS